MGLSVPSGTKWEKESGLDGTLRECGGLSGTEDLCLLIRVSIVKNHNQNDCTCIHKCVYYVKNTWFISIVMTEVGWI